MGPSEGHLHADAAHPIVAALAGDPVLLGLWGYLRLAVRPMMLGEICAATRLDVVTVQRKLDALGALGLVEAIPATTRRPGFSYRIRYEGLQVRCTSDGDREITQKFSDAMQRYAKDVLASNGSGDHANGSDIAGVFHLTPPEVEELRRRLNSLVEFTEMIGAKRAKRGAAPELCNYVVHFRVEPLSAPALPLAPVRFVLDGAEPPAHEPAAERPANGKLSAREHQVATALARGLTIEEVAKEMGLARSTVSTMTKRLYRKLGVRRRAEMVTRLSENGLGG